MSHSSEGLSIEGGGSMLRTTLYVRVVLIVAAIAALALMLGGEPWGPR